MKNFYITSPIYYVNDVPHIGHAYTSIACDTKARFQRFCGDEVRFLTGTDEHGQKVEKSALARNKTPQEFCDEVSQKFFDLTKILNLSNDDFIRTTEDRHKKFAQEFWQKLEKNGYIYKDVYEGWYSIRDEAFYSESELVNGKAPSGAEVSWHKEESYFFKLSAFQEKLLTLYEAAPDFVLPHSKMNEVISFVKGGLQDLSISRTSFKWGINVPNDEKHIMYVWLDALTNYISALQSDELYQKFWLDAANSPLHIVGKDILRFHAVYWPAFLMAADFPLPYGVFAHGWWTNEGQKISKSVGNVIDPIKEIEWIESMACKKEVAVEYFKYFLLREIPFGNDGDYSRTNLINRINAELANNIGNLVQRVLSMIYKNNQGVVVDFSHFKPSEELLGQGYALQQKLVEKMQELNFGEAISEIINFATKCNQFIDYHAPWRLKKEGKEEEMNLVLSTVLEGIRLIAVALRPFLCNLSKNIGYFLQIEDEVNILMLSKEFALKANHKIKEPQILFTRLGVK